MKVMQLCMVVMFCLCPSLVALASGDLSVSGKTTTTNLTITSLDCTTNAHGGALTADASGVVSCSDDDGLQLVAGDPVLLSKANGWGYEIDVSGRYAYVVAQDLNIFDITDPLQPELVGNMSLCAVLCTHLDIFVAGRYAYVTNTDSTDLTIIDVSDPSNPFVAGSTAVGLGFHNVFVSGRYAYLAAGNEIKVVDITDPALPSIVGSLATGTTNVRSIHVSGKYAYAVFSGSQDLKIFDVSNPQSPGLVNSFGLGVTAVWSMFVSGRYAYVCTTTISGPSELVVVDISDPTTPSVADRLTVGDWPTSVFVSGRYAYVVDGDSDDLRVIDAINPNALSLAGIVDLLTIHLGSTWRPAVHVAGGYAYVADTHDSKLKVFEISAAEFSSVVAHSLEAGQLQVRDDVIAQGQLQVTGGINVGSGGIFSDGNVGISGSIALTNDVVPSSSITNGVLLYAANAAGSSELRVRDEAGIVTLLSPHNFSLIGQPSEPLAWSFYSESDAGKINVDMLRAMRLVEVISGQKLVHTEIQGKADPGASEHTNVISTGLPSIETLQTQLKAYHELVTPLIAAVQELKTANARLTQRLEVLEQGQD